MSALSDFRIILPTDVEFSDRELDWVETTHQWRLSDKEYGSVAWEFDRDPSELDLLELRYFFEVPGDSNLDTLVRLSPGELATLHANSNEPARIKAMKCEMCGQHWIVYKLSGTTWLKYGRKCHNSGWWLGTPVETDEVTGVAGT